MRRPWYSAILKALEAVIASGASSLPNPASDAVRFLAWQNGHPFREEDTTDLAKSQGFCNQKVRWAVGIWYKVAFCPSRKSALPTDFLHKGPKSALKDHFGSYVLWHGYFLSNFTLYSATSYRISTVIRTSCRRSKEGRSTSTGWQSSLCKTSSWIQNNSSVLAWPVLAWLGQSGTFDLKSTGGFAQAALSPCGCS